MWNLKLYIWNYTKNETTTVIAKCCVIYHAPVIIPINRLIITSLQHTVVRKTHGTLNSVRRVRRTWCVGHLTVWDVCNVWLWTCNILDINKCVIFQFPTPTITPQNIAIKVCDTKWCKLGMLPVSYCTSFYEFGCSNMSYLKVQDIILLCKCSERPWCSILFNLIWSSFGYW